MNPFLSLITIFVKLEDGFVDTGFLTPSKVHENVPDVPLSPFFKSIKVTVKTFLLISQEIFGLLSFWLLQV